MPSCAIWRSSTSNGQPWSSCFRYMKQYLYIKQNRICGVCRNAGVLLVFLVCVVLTATPALANQQPPSSGGSVLNILLLGLIAYFLVRAFRRRAGGDNDRDKPERWSDNRPDADNTNDERGRVIRPMDRHEAARQMWGHLSSEKQPPEQGTPVPPVGTEGFNESEFLEGAKLFFSRFQEASDSREFDDLKVFLSDEVYADAVVHAQSNPVKARSEIMLLNARLMEVKSEGGRTLATVFYDAQIRKGISGEQPVHVRAVWEFSRDDAMDNALWKLEKINKVDQ